MKTINERIKYISDTLFDGNVSAFGRHINVPQPTLKDVVGGKLSTPRFDLLEKIVNDKSLNINSEWLMTGEGHMLKNISENSENLLKQSEKEDRNNSIDDIITNLIKETVMNEIPAIIKAVGEAMRAQQAEQNAGLQKYLDNQKDASKLQMELFRDVVKILAKSDPVEAKELDDKIIKFGRKAV